MSSVLTSIWQALDPARRSVAQAYQEGYRLWAARRYKDDFDRVARFCLFIGYPRSGHSLVGAMLNAHRDVVIAHELTAHEIILEGCSRDELFSRIIARASWFNLIGNRGTYPYQIPNQWQGRFESLKVVGDKRGGGVTRYLAAHPDLLDRVRAVVQVPLRLVHVVRNPFDNISAMSIWNKLSLEAAAERYFLLSDTTTRLAEMCEPSEIITVYHEKMIHNPSATLSALCSFLEIDDYPGYGDDCCSIVFGRPTQTRRKVDWSRTLVREVERRTRSNPFLRGYQFGLGDDPPLDAASP